MSGEVVVVGAGVAGLAVAFELARRGAEVRVLEREAAGRGTTSAAGGMLAPVSEADTEHPELVRLGLESLERWPAFARDVERASGRSCGYRRDGSLWVALDRDDVADLERLRAILEERKLGAERITGEEVRRLEPGVAPRVIAGLSVPGDLHVHPRRLAAALATAVRALGGTIAEGHRAVAVEAVGGRLAAVRYDDGSGHSRRITTDRAVVAAGPEAWRSIEIPLPDPGLRPVKGQLVRLSGPEIARRVLRTPEVYLVPHDGGELLVGATTEERGFDRTPTAGAVRTLLRRAREVLPEIDELAFDGVSVGSRPALPDHLPGLGPTAIEGLHVAIGHYRNGILLAPATARLVAAAVLGTADADALAPFALARFDRG